MDTHEIARQELARRAYPANSFEATFNPEFDCPNCGHKVMVHIHTHEIKGQRTGIPCTNCDKTTTLQWDFTQTRLSA